VSVTSNDDTIGCLIAVAALLGGGWWLYNKYEIRERESEAYPDLIEPAPIVTRPTGQIELLELSNGSVWRLDAASVSGPREARQLWVFSDHTKNSTVEARETQTLYRVNCDTTAYRVLKVVDYDKDGKPLGMWSSEDFSKTEDFPPPRSNISYVVNRGCDPAFDPPAEPAMPPRIEINGK
jgi:hypothetical protein